MLASDALPPQNLDAERGVLGSILLDNDALHDVAAILAAGDFYRDTHQLIYRAILDLYDLGRPVDAIILNEELMRRGQFDAVGGDGTIAGLFSDLNHAANARYYAEIVRQKATTRELIGAAEAIIRDGYSNSFTSEELFEAADRRIFEAARSAGPGQTRSIGELNEQTRRSIAAKKEGKADDGISSGIGGLDDVLGGFQPGQMIVLAGRPSMGKTSLAFNFAGHLAVEQCVGVLFVSLEMVGGEFSERFLSLRSGVPMNKVRRPHFAGPDDLRRVEAIIPEDAAPLWIDDSSSLSATQIAALARRHRQRHGLGLLVIDYLQLIEAENPREPRHEQVAATSRRLKALAKDLGVPLLALSQLNRDSENRKDKRPLLSDLRESGQIEQDADVVMLIHRPEYYAKADRPGIAELIVAKNRNGATPIVELVFEKELMRFSDAARDRERFL